MLGISRVMPQRGKCVSFSLLSWLTWPCWGCALSLCAAVGAGRTKKGQELCVSPLLLGEQLNELGQPLARWGCSGCLGCLQHCCPHSGSCVEAAHAAGADFHCAWGERKAEPELERATTRGQEMFSSLVPSMGQKAKRFSPVIFTTVSGLLC